MFRHDAAHPTHNKISTLTKSTLPVKYVSRRLEHGTRATGDGWEGRPAATLTTEQSWVSVSWMKMDCLILGAFQTNCYVLRASATATECLIIDPGLQADALIDFLDRHELKPVATVLTHGHADHMAGVTLLRSSFPDMTLHVHRLDAEMLVQPEHNLSAFAGELVTTGPADVLLEDGDIIEQAGVKLQVLHTPGHTPGGICLYAKDEGRVFTNDTLFAESIGRTDFPGGSMSQLMKSIKEKLLVLPDETEVCPGHGPTTTIGREKAHNPFLI